MKTDELVALLATGAAAVDPHTVARRYAIALGLGALAAISMMVIALGIRADIAEAVRLPMFWVKLAYPAILAAGGLFAATRLSRPGAALGWVPGALLAPAIAFSILAAYVLLAAPSPERAALIFGSTWKSCLIEVPKLAIPLFIATLWAMRGLAPTRLAFAGAAAGLLAGAVAAAIYALHCPEMEAPFIGIWYSAGMLIPAVVGALIGPTVLRW